MATREKKLSLGRKQNTASPLPPKEDPASGEIKPNTTEPVISEDSEILNKTATATNTTPLVRKLARKPTPKKNPNKQRVAIRLKPKIKKTIEIKKKIKGILQKTQTQKKLLKTSTKQVKIKRTRVKRNDLPPVLEPILPIDENSDAIKPSKKKGGGKPPRIDNYANKKVKTEPAETITENLVVDKSKPKRVYKRKTKIEPTSNESIEDVMNDLTSLIETSDIKKESTEATEANKTELPKSKKVVKKRRKENIENILSKLSPADRKVIDMLDLNVQKFKGLPDANLRRRHSIEKFPVGPIDSDNINQLSIFNTLPRCISPRSKNMPKGLNRRSNPYKTRSDSPARILRNGKHRKLKDLELLEGLDITKRRKRNYSDLSGSEMSVSKFSGYESDSSYSDLSSLHGAENPEQTTKDTDMIKTENQETTEELPLVSPDLDCNSLKRSISTENERVETIMDTNSNLYLELNSKDTEISACVKSEEPASISPSLKVPDKSIILDIMKQTFNDSLEDRSKSNSITPRPIAPQNFCESLNTEIKSEAEIVESQTISKEDKITIEETVEKETEQIIENGDPDKTPNGLTEQDKSIKNEESLKIEETPEDLAVKENILQALGLQSLQAAEEARLKSKDKAEVKPTYTGTLKTIIKLNRGDKKKGRSMKMTLQKNKSKLSEYDFTPGVDDLEFKAIKEVNFR